MDHIEKKMDELEALIEGYEALAERAKALYARWAEVKDRLSGIEMMEDDIQRWGEK